MLSSNAIGLWLSVTLRLLVELALLLVVMTAIMAYRLHQRAGTSCRTKDKRVAQHCVFGVP